MIVNELNNYFLNSFPTSDIKSETIVNSNPLIRVELHNKSIKSIVERTTKATEKAVKIFYEVFNPENELWIIIYEWETPFNNSKNNYLYQQFAREVKFFKYSDIENGKIIISKTSIDKISIKNISKGIANLEMGLNPGIDQRVYFIDPQANIGYHMYDDRGCIVWSNNQDKIKNIKTAYNSVYNQ